MRVSQLRQALRLLALNACEIRILPVVNVSCTLWSVDRSDSDARPFLSPFSVSVAVAVTRSMFPVPRCICNACRDEMEGSFYKRCRNSEGIADSNSEATSKIILITHF